MLSPPITQEFKSALSDGACLVRFSSPGRHSDRTVVAKKADTWQPSGGASAIESRPTP